jgi:hypothetical protein
LCFSGAGLPPLHNGTAKTLSWLFHTVKSTIEVRILNIHKLKSQIEEATSKKVDIIIDLTDDSKC